MPEYLYPEELRDAAKSNLGLWLAKWEEMLRYVGEPGSEAYDLKILARFPCFDHQIIASRTVQEGT